MLERSTWSYHNAVSKIFASSRWLGTTTPSISNSMVNLHCTWSPRVLPPFSSQQTATQYTVRGPDTTQSGHVTPRRGATPVADKRNHVLLMSWNAGRACRSANVRSKPELLTPNLAPAADNRLAPSSRMSARPGPMR
ncbi:unnamed protein product [Prorocentrum cordatum]|uniref:Uncharacterized protein n=1 Tax=Prorocentrum cordatum TaxID=2364126 RepID=A0ABN9PFQ4_9DINO|nr:unnamed protein product [Polarella glacialis]